MNFDFFVLDFSLVLAVLVVGVAGLYFFTRFQTGVISRQYPAIGEYIDVGGFKLHYVDIPATDNADLPPMVFIHGASGNLRDPMLAFEQPLKGRGRIIFVDRPGHGYSQRGDVKSRDPAEQAGAIAQLLDRLGISRAVLIGHSYGGAITAAFGVHFPEKVKGLVFLAPASHPWPGGVSWYYTIAAMPVIGHLFTELASLPAGLWQMKCAINGVFFPNKPPENYFRHSGTELVLRPAVFRYNARDVVYLHQSVKKLAPRYKEITAPTVIITGDQDGIVLAHIHSKGLERDIAGSKLIEFKNMGHKPDYAATQAAIEAIEEVSK